MDEYVTIRKKHLQRPIFRLRCLVKQLEKGDVNVVDLKKNIEYAASVLEAVYIDETRRLLDTEDELSDIQTDSVPSEVRDWLASTFTRKMGMMKKKPEEKTKVSQHCPCCPGWDFCGKDVQEELSHGWFDISCSCHSDTQGS